MNTEIYAVNSIHFNNRHGTFATGGGDGVFAFWDKDNKQRLFLLGQKDNKRMDTSISKVAFSKDSDFFGYVVSYDWSRGYNAPDRQVESQIYIMPVPENDIKPKPK